MPSFRGLFDAVGQTFPLFASICKYSAVLIDSHSGDINRVAGRPASDKVGRRSLTTVFTQAPSGDIPAFQGSRGRMG